MGQGWSTYIVQLHSNIFVEADTSKNCQIYPNNEYATYDECDKDYIDNTLARKFGPNFVPVWATTDGGREVSTAMWENMSNLPNLPDKLHDQLVPIFEGTEASQCPLPCTTTSTTIRQSLNTFRHV